MRPPYRALVALAVLLASAAPALAVQEWYAYYLQARDGDIPASRWPGCVRNLRRAQQLRRASGIDVRTYGLEFIDYLPHYYMGRCLLEQESYAEAIEAFTREEQQGAIQRRPTQHNELVRLRGKAQSAQGALTARRAREHVEGLLAEAQELGRRKGWDEALAKLVAAEAIAKALDTDTLRRITSEQERQRAARGAAADGAARARRLEQLVADGQRLLQEGKLSDAMLAFNEALDIAPRDERALTGRDAARERILGTTTREKRKQALAAGRSLVEAGLYEQALVPLTDAAADPENFEARTLLARARQVVEGVRRGKEQQAEIERLLARGEGLMGTGSFPQAAVAFESVLRLDPGHARARERQAEAEKRTGEAIVERWLPNREPTLLLVPSEEVLESPTLSLEGYASDDRGIQKVEFRVADRLLAEEIPQGESVRNLRFVKELPLEPGVNRVAVTAVDSGGLSFTIPFSVERKLRFHETAYFLPSALGSAVSLLGLGWGVQRLRRRRAHRLRFNPYIAGAPVLDEQMFYGRAKLTARMLSTLHRNSLMITGERRIGKTTFLHHLKGVLEQDDAGDWKFFPVFVDLQGVPEQAFFHALMAEIADGLALSSATSESLRFRPEREGYEARDFSHDLQLVLAELKTRSERKVKLAFLIDEVDVLNEYSESVNQRLRGIFMKSFSENLVAVMSGVAIRRRWQSEVSPWYNFFDEIELPPFTREEAEALIRQPVAGVFRFQPEAVDSILGLSRLRPYLVQKYCVHAVNHMLEAGRSTVRLEDVSAARQAVEVEGQVEAEPADVRPVAD